MAADRLIGSGGPWEDAVGYSRAVVAGPFVLVSGSTATVDGQVRHPGDAYAQAMEAFGVVRRALEDAGCGLAFAPAVNRGAGRAAVAVRVGARLGVRDEGGW